MDPPGLHFVTDAFVQMLATVTGKPVGDGDAPPELADRDDYAIVEELPGGYSDGDIVTPDATVYAIYQVTSIGVTRHAAGAMRDACHKAILGRSTSGGFTHPIDAYKKKDQPQTVQSLLTDALVKVSGRSHDSTGGIVREGQLFNAFERYELWICPA